MLLTENETHLVKTVLEQIISATDDADSWGRVKVPFNFSPLERHDITQLLNKLGKPSDQPDWRAAYVKLKQETLAARYGFGGRKLREQLMNAKNKEVLQNDPMA